MTTARLAAIQRELGLHPRIIGKAGRPGTFRPEVIAPHWTAVASSPGDRHPSLGVVTNGRKGLSGPLYGDLVPYQTDPARLQVIQITVGRTNNFGMGVLATLRAVAGGRPAARRPAGRDTHGLNAYADAVSADYHPAQGAPPAAMVEAFVRAVAARCIYRGLPAHAVLDHAQGTRRKIDLLTGWPQPEDLRARVAAAMRITTQHQEDEDMNIRIGSKDTGDDTAVRDLEELTNNFAVATGSTSPLIDEDGEWTKADADAFSAHVVGRLRHPAFHQLAGLTIGKHASGRSVSPTIIGVMAAVLSERR